jgi:hypothetical protein
VEGEALGLRVVGGDVVMVPAGTAAEGAAVGLGVLRFLGHDCVNEGEGEDTCWFVRGCNALADHAVVVTAAPWDNTLLLVLPAACKNSVLLTKSCFTESVILLSTSSCHVNPGGRSPGDSVCWSKYSSVALPCELQAMRSPSSTGAREEHSVWLGPLMRTPLVTVPLCRSTCTTIMSFWDDGEENPAE